MYFFLYFRSKHYPVIKQPVASYFSVSLVRYDMVHEQWERMEMGKKGEATPMGGDGV